MNTYLLISLIVIILGIVIYQQIQIKKLKRALTDFAIQHYTDFSTLTHNYSTADEEVHKILREVEVQITDKMKLENTSLIVEVTKSIEKIRKELPTTNDELLAEVQQMRDDFFALRQNL
tara:strand:- start:59 stop:415 length:357 start_codon:yes stop_codon:yes gene_type:complete